MYSSRNIDDLRKDVAANCRVLLQLCKEAGLKVLVTGTVRDDEYQQWAYEHGFASSPIPSFHGQKAGLAFDICKNIKGHEYDDLTFFSQVGAIGKKIGFTWGGDWTSFVDRPHFQWDQHGKYTSAMIRRGEYPPTMPAYGGEKTTATNTKGTRAYPFLGKFKCTSGYGQRSAVSTTQGKSSTDHKGIDLVGTSDTTIVACESGTVQRATFQKVLGNYIFIKTDSGYGNIYQHLSKMYVKVGDRVTCKQKIGVQGATGNVSGAHLHFGVTSNTDFRSYYDNNWINPAIWLGIANPGTVKGKTFNGAGYITGYASGVTSSNNNTSSITTTTDTGKPKQTTTSSTTVKPSNNGQNGTGVTPSTGYDSIVPSGQNYKVTDFKGVVSDWLYGRRYRVYIDIGGSKAFDVSDLRCTFSVTKSCTLQANASTLTIYNLNPMDENVLIKEGQRIVIEAGYSGSQYGKIFDGNVIQPIRSKENGTDYLLTLVSMDSDRYVNYGLVGVSLVAQQSSRDAVNALILRSSETIGRGSIINGRIEYPRGKVLFGMCKDFLEQIARSENSQFYTDDGKVNIISSSDVSSGSVLAFGPQTGLIGTPTQTENGIQCKVLLNPFIKLNTLFYIDNKKVTGKQYQMGRAIRALDQNGIYRVIKFTHKGDTHGNEWYTEIEAITQAGIIPAMVAGNSFYMW